MKQIDYIDLFNREKQKNDVLSFLTNFSTNSPTQTKGMYLLGPPGCGKTSFIDDIIPSDIYDVIKYDANDNRTKSSIPEILGKKMSNFNVLELFNKKKKKIVIVMDEMDYMSSGDKGGIKELIKFVRAKRTKKQNAEPYSVSPVIFIGTNNNDKKIKELINVTKLVELHVPTDAQVIRYIKSNMGLIDNKYIQKMVNYANGNLRKLTFFIEFYNKNTNNLNYLVETLENEYLHQNYTTTVIRNLYTKYVPISEYSTIIKETDRTTLGLLWHENLSSIINTYNKCNIRLYKKILDNLSLTDYIDRVIFQNQVWKLSEQNSFIKTFFNNFYLHNEIKNIHVPNDIIFTKVLTKYSTEYNNFCFFMQLEQKLFLEMDDIIRLFNNNSDTELMKKYFLTQLDIGRVKRFIENGKLVF